MGFTGLRLTSANQWRLHGECLERVRSVLRLVMIDWRFPPTHVGHNNNQCILPHPEPAFSLECTRIYFCRRSKRKFQQIFRLCYALPLKPKKVESPCAENEVRNEKRPANNEGAVMQQRKTRKSDKRGLFRGPREHQSVRKNGPQWCPDAFVAWIQPVSDSHLKTKGQRRQFRHFYIG